LASCLALFEPSSDVREVYNYVRALEYGLERLRTLPLNADKVLAAIEEPLGVDDDAS